MIYAIIFLLFVYITGTIRKQKIKKALEKHLLIRREEISEEKLKKFYDNNLQKWKYV